MLALRRTPGQAIFIGEYKLRFISVTPRRITGTVVDSDGNATPWDWFEPTMESNLQVGSAIVHFGSFANDFTVQVGIQAPADVAIVREERLERPSAP
jgi:sRNA-binding carbon storage regulator CsrA